MKKIKLATLAVIMAISAYGAYGNAHSNSTVYDIMPNTSPTTTSYMVAPWPPSDGCVGNAEFVCSVIASFGYSSGQFIPASECVVFTLYN